jgi:hypothetical protein
MSLIADSPPHLPSADPVELKPEEKPASELKPEEAPSEPKPLETAPPSMPSSQEIVTQIICDSKDKPAEAPNCPSVDSVVQPPQSTKTTRRKQRLAEGLSSEGETSDEDFTGEEYLRTADKKRKVSQTDMTEVKICPMRITWACFVGATLDSYERRFSSFYPTSHFG